MKITLLKSDILSPAFAARDGYFLELAPDVTPAFAKSAKTITLPKKLIPGTDYAIMKANAALKAVKLTSAPKPDALGGFHVGLDGIIARHSIWDVHFRPACADPRGMVFVPKVGWVDIYLLNTDPHTLGTSAAGAEIADGLSEVMCPNGTRRRLTWWVANHVLAASGKQLLSREEFATAMQGVEEGKNNGNDPCKTDHAPGLKSLYGIEQATGCMWTWSRDIEDLRGPWLYLMGGDWYSGSAGPRRSYGTYPDSYWDFVAARGRCDHLWPERSEAKA